MSLEAKGLVGTGDPKRGHLTASHMQGHPVAEESISSCCSAVSLSAAAPEEGQAGSLNPHQNPEDDEKLSCDSLPGAIGR